ncbi:Ada metal-binding domain-containing protein [Acidaminococcus massiliensis]|jgi:methylphosphotriester-DNA--protein-cysteine methyltransferase|uniref:Ada metal-binding domain-containing protein n=1 Tax=Acidaminococcus massiliensis TaxID=1852375 RepID=UPI0009F1B0CB|nr:Ada metal-binding domain-containing protein [Acidaminococcus massiliensis]
MRKIALLTALLVTLCSTALAYVGNSASHKFHYEGCRAEQRIRADHRVHFDTREEAIDAGYTPCGICRP